MLSSKRVKLFFGVLVISLLIFIFFFYNPTQGQTQDSQLIVNYEYDLMNRITKISHSNGVIILYTYDDAGNILERRITDQDTSVQSWSLW